MGIIGVVLLLLWPENDNEQPFPINKAPQNEIVSEDDSSSTNNEEENTNDGEEKTITEEFKEVFASVIDGAKGLFIRQDLEIVAIGDSLTQGVGDESDNGGYVGILERSLKDNETVQDIEIANYGKRGNRTDQLLKRLNKKEISQSIEGADIILITIGANDIMEIVRDNFTNLNYDDFVKEQTKYQTRLESIFDTIQVKNSDANIYLIGLFNPFKQYFSHIPELENIVRDWNDIGREVTSDYDNVSFIPVKDIFEDVTKDLYYEDNFHPNYTGYKLIAERVFEYIKEDVQLLEEEENQ